MEPNGSATFHEQVDDAAEEVEIIGPPEIVDPNDDNADPDGQAASQEQPAAPSPFPEPGAARVELLDCNAQNAFIYQMYIQGDHVECKSLIGEVLHKYDGRCEYALHMRGCIAREEGDLHDALNWFGQAYDVSAHNYKYLVEMGRANFLLGRHSMAVEQLERAASAFPGNPKIYYWLARSIYHLEPSKRVNPVEKARDLLLNTPLISSDPQLLKFLAKLLEELDDVTAAIEAYKRVLELQPENQDVLVKLGLLYLRTGNEDAAFAAFGQSLAFDPTNAEAILALGAIVQTHGDHDVALNKYRVAASVCDYNGCLWNNIGVGMLSRNKLAAAHSSLKKAAYIMPLDYKINFNLGLLHESMGLNCSALFFLKKAADLKRDDAKIVGAMAVVLSHMGDVVNARRAYQRSIELEPLPTTLLNYALFEYHQDKKEASWTTLHQLRALQNSGVCRSEEIVVADTLEEALLDKGMLSMSTTAKPLDQFANPLDE